MAETAMEKRQALLAQPHPATASPALIGERSVPMPISDERRIVGILTCEFAAVVLTQKIAIPLGGAENQIAVALLIHYAVLVYLFVFGYARIDTPRLLLLCLFSATAIFSQVGKAVGAFSLPSLLLMLVTSTILVVVIPVHRSSYLQILRGFITLSMCASVMVLGDWIVQLAGFPMPSLETVTPKPWIYLEYVYVQPLQWDSPWFKPNGLFFLEASHVSQFIAMGLVIELAFFRRPAVIALNAIALFFSYGGTGLVIVALSIPFLAARLRPSVLISSAVIAVAVLVIAGSLGLLEAFINRSAEFSQSNSSGYNRFILPVERFAQLLQDQPERLFFGMGAGTMPKAVNNLAQLTFGLAWPPYAKLAVEYGIITFLCWIVFFTFSFFGGGAPLVVIWVAFVQYQLLNGSLNVPIHTIYGWLLCAGYHFIDHELRRENRTARQPKPPRAVALGRNPGAV
ncbi:hypothetical protein V1281_002250 [Nitrobacteraceae bacterium AZCC 2161]